MGYPWRLKELKKLKVKRKSEGRRPTGKMLFKFRQSSIDTFLDFSYTCFRVFSKDSRVFTDKWKRRKVLQTNETKQRRNLLKGNWKVLKIISIINSYFEISSNEFWMWESFDWLLLLTQGIFRRKRFKNFMNNRKNFKNSIVIFVLNLIFRRKSLKFHPLTSQTNKKKAINFSKTNFLLIKNFSHCLFRFLIQKYRKVFLSMMRACCKRKSNWNNVEIWKRRDEKQKPDWARQAIKSRENEIFINLRVTNFVTTNFFFFLNDFGVMQSRLVNAEIVLFVETRRVSRVANDKRSSVEVHATLIATNKQMRTLTHRCGAVDDGSAERGGAVGWTCMDFQAVVGTCNAGNRF